MQRRLILLADCSVALLAACQGERTVTPLERPAGIEVMVSVAPQLREIADLLAWPDGSIPNATVIVRAADAAPETIIDSSSTDNAGTASFTSLPEGAYVVRVTRELSPEERSRASAAIGDVYALEGVASVTGAGQISVSARGVTRGSLVLMEVFASAVSLPAGGEWTDGNYVKIYNNSDTTVELADKLFFEAFVAKVEAPLYPCSTWAGLMADPAGIWAQFIFRFPKGAAPLPPGESVLLATDAINHKQFGQSSGFHDLSDAGFEFRGSSDVDNPAAEDMLSVGPRSYALFSGWRPFALRNAVGLANALAIDTLRTQFNADWGGGTTFVRIPKAALLDIIQWDTKYDRGYPLCPSSVFSDFDAVETRIIFPWDTLSMHRRVRYVLPDGRPVLQRSKNSAADWIAAPGTPNNRP